MQRVFVFAFAALFAGLLGAPAEAQSRLDAGRSKAHKTSCSDMCQKKFTAANAKQTCLNKCKAAGKR